jgi:hypothetical protein
VKVRSVFLSALAVMTLLPGCSTGSGSSSGCEKARQQDLAYLRAGLATASPQPNSHYGQTFPGFTPSPIASGTVLAWFAGPTVGPKLDTQQTLPGDAEAAAHQYLLAAYVEVQHATCFTAADLAASQLRIDQSK